MKKVILFEQFISEAANIKDTAKNILDGLDSTAQLHVDYIPKEALSTIESSLKKNKSLSGKDAAKAAKEIRMNLEEIGILSNTFSPMDVEIIIMKHLNESINESEKVIKGIFGVKKVQTLIDKYGRDNGLFFKRKSDGKLYGVGSLFLDTDNKDFAVIDAGGDDEYIDYKDIDYVVIKESVVNEAKTSTREEIMDLMETKYKIKHVRTSEEFMRGDEGGIWIAGDNGEELSGNKIFDYYNGSAKYKNGVLKNVVDAVEKKGWWFSWNDPGTMMMWPKN
jgi:hypothetical protein